MNSSIRCSVCSAVISGVAVFGPIQTPLCWQHWYDAIEAGKKAEKAPETKERRRIEAEISCKRTQIEDLHEEIVELEEQINELIDELGDGLLPAVGMDFVEIGVAMLTQAVAT